MSASTNVQQRPNFDATDMVRDVSDLLSVLVMKRPIMELVNFQSGPPAFNHKHEWYDKVVTQPASALTANITAHAASATGVTVNVTDGTKFTVGDQITVDGLQQTYQITAIVSNALTCTEIRGVALGSDAGSGADAKYNRGVLEETTYGTAKGADLALNAYNYTQIFRDDISVSWHAQAMSVSKGVYLFDDLFAEAIDDGLKRMSWNLYNAVTRGRRVERSSTSTIGMMGGIRQFIDVSGGNSLSSSGAITYDKLNIVSKYIYDDTADLSNVVIVMPTHINKQLAALDTNYFRYNDPGSKRTIGSNVTTYTPDIGGSGGIPIITDPNMPLDEVWFVDKSQIRMIPLNGFSMSVYRQNVPGSTAYNAFMYGEYTLEVRQGAYMHGLIKGLSTS